jgi:hypothetical protein
MECCLAPRRKNRPPAQDYRPYDSAQIPVLPHPHPNDIASNNLQIEKTQKLSKFGKMSPIAQEHIPHPPPTMKVRIEM